MSRKGYVCGALMMLALTATSCRQEPDQGALAAVAAKGYYDLLLEGKYGEFVDGTYRPDSIPPGYREQLVTNARMFAEQQSAEHRGIKEVRIVEARADTVRRTAEVFLTFDYGDSTSEEVVVPMVRHHGRWMLR